MSTVLKARSALGVASRRGAPDDIRTARRALAAAKLEAYVSRIVAEAPPLTEDQKHRIVSLLGAAA